MNNKLIAIGELLIDFTSSKTGEIKNIESFIKNPGGAPANVAVCCSKLGGNSLFITKLGNDAFGDYLLDVLNDNNVNTSFVRRTSLANTPLAFVSLKDNGERDFSFYRNPSSDLFLEPSDIDEKIFNKGDILHFCSVDLVDYPVKQAHLKAIEYALKHDLIISFDPNLRFSLWDNANKLKCTVLEFIPYAHIIKVSDEELQFLTDINNEESACKSLFKGNVQLVIVTKGKDGATIYTRDGNLIVSPGRQVKAIDTTGAGDAFIGSFLFQLLKDGVSVSSLLFYTEKYQEFLNFSNLVSSIVVTKYGALPALPTIKEVKELQYEK